MNIANLSAHNDEKNYYSLVSVVSDVILTEAKELNAVVDKTKHALAAAAQFIHDNDGILIVSGLGKSGHVGRKIASTFQSLGKGAVFLHAAEASHGDLGVIADNSAVLVLSNSGETTELSDLLSYCKEYQHPIISVTASAASTLGKHSHIVIEHGQLTEACVNGLAPTTSTTVALALGDALAVGVSSLSEMTPQDFRRYHPGGKLGARLLEVGEVMLSGEALPIVDPSMSMQEVVITMSAKGLGTAIVCDGKKLVGIITDGDMRRNVGRLFQSTAKDIMSTAPQTVLPSQPAADALRLMNDTGITSVIVSSRNCQVDGLLHIHDCIRLGVGK